MSTLLSTDTGGDDLYAPPHESLREAMHGEGSVVKIVREKITILVHPWLTWMKPEWLSQTRQAHDEIWC